MHRSTKIATCSYCGTRAALVLRGRERHELSCASCGAPLHELKAMPLRPDPAPRGTRAEHAARRGAKGSYRARRKPPKPARPRRRGKGGLRRLLDEAFDVIEDIFD